MSNKVNHTNQTINKERRSLLQGAALVGAAGFAPAVFGKTVMGSSEPELSGQLICKIFDPVKTLVLRNNSEQTMVIDQVSQGALMFDGSIVDCNGACQDQSITIAPHQEVHVKFKKRQQLSPSHNIAEIQRIQSRVTRLHDGTRVIPFTATLKGKVATIA